MMYLSRRLGMKRRAVSAIMAVLLGTMTILALGGCYLFQAPSSETVESVSIEPKIIEIREGEDTDISIKVLPETLQGKVKISYSVEKDALAEIIGTDDTAIVTGWVRGITHIYASTPDGTTAQALVNIKSAGATADSQYLTTPKRIISTTVGNDQLMSASLVGGTVPDQENIVWKISNSAIGRIVGSGSTALLQVTGLGEGTITIAHPKAAASITIDVVVGGSGVQLLLDKYAVAGNVGSYYEIKASLSNVPDGMVVSPTDIAWELVVPDGEMAIGSLVGKVGYNTTINLAREGTQRIMATFSNGARAYCDVTAVLGEGISASSNNLVMKPGQSRTITYYPSPSYATVTLVNSNGAVVQTSQNATTHEVTITTLGEGSATVELQTGYKSKTDIYVTSAYTKELNVDMLAINGVTGDSATKTVNFTVSPPDTTVSAIASSSTFITGLTVNKASGTITFVSSQEGSGYITINATNGQSKRIDINNTSASADWSLKATALDTGSSWGDFGLTMTSANSGYVDLRDGSSLQIQVVGVPDGMLYTSEVSYMAGGTIPDDTFSWSQADAGKTIILAYHPHWTIFNTKYSAGTIMIKATHPASGTTKIFAIDIATLWAKAG